MKLLTQENLKSLPPLYSTEKLGEDAIVQVKFFTPDSSWTWFATEFDPKTGTFFGLCCGSENELGYFTLAELESARGPLGLKIERDKWFKPKTLKECRPENWYSR